MLHIGSPGLGHRIEIDVNYTIEVANGHLDNTTKLLKVKGASLDESRKTNRGQITDRRLILVRILHDFRAVAGEYSIEDTRIIDRLVEAEGVIIAPEVIAALDNGRMLDAILVGPGHEAHTRDQVLGFDPLAVSDVAAGL